MALLLLKNSIHVYILQQTPKSGYVCTGCGGGGGGGSEHNVQMFQMTLLLFKEYKCAKLF